MAVSHHQDHQASQRSKAPSGAGAVLEIEGVSKAYRSSLALRDVTLDVTSSVIHGLLGKNGAGKSTLAGIIAGFVSPSSGTVRFRGKDITGLSPSQRQGEGIRLLPQHSEIFPDLSIGENLLLPNLPRRWGLTDWRRMHEDAGLTLEEHGLPVSPRLPARTLSLGQSKRLAIIKAMMGDARLIILDEPTAGLTFEQRRDLMAWIKALTVRGTSFIYISHHNDEVRQLCGEYSVLRDGAVAARGRAEDLSAEKLARLVTGEAVHEFHRERRTPGKVILELRGFSSDGFSGVDLDLCAGEVVGLVGLPGSGAQELLRALGGLAPARGGAITLDGRNIVTRSPRRSLAGGLAYLTHDRISEGVVSMMSIADNVHLGHWPVRETGTLDQQAMRRQMDEARAQTEIVMASPSQEIGELSGGNQQKVLMARLLGRKPRVLLLDEPTVGVDIAAKEEIHRMIDRATSSGMAVLLRAYDPDEMVRLVDRAVVFSNGAVVRQLSGKSLTIDALATAQELGEKKLGQKEPGEKE